MTANPARGHRFVVPEVVQTSAMDCGPAALKCLLEGFGISVGYGRLREACQTDVDGTSIDTLEAIAVQLGLEAEQVMLPVDHLLVKARHGCLYIFAESSRLYLRKSQLNEQVCGVEAKHTRHRRETLR